MRILFTKALLVTYLLTFNVAIAEPYHWLEPRDCSETTYVEELVTRQDLERCVEDMAAKFGADAHQMKVTINGESSWRKRVVNDQEQHADGSTSSYHLCQFHPDTFMWMATEAGVENPDIENMYHQIQAMAWGFANGHARHWTVWRDNFE